MQAANCVTHQTTRDHRLVNPARFELALMPWKGTVLTTRRWVQNQKPYWSTLVKLKYVTSLTRDQPVAATQSNRTSVLQYGAFTRNRTEFSGLQNPCITIYALKANWYLPQLPQNIGGFPRKNMRFETLPRNLIFKTARAIAEDALSTLYNYYSAQGCI